MSRALGVPTLLGVPYDASSSFLRGPSEAPRCIREALHSPSANMWTEDLRDLGAGGWRDGGDVALPTSGDPRASIEDGVRALLNAGGRPLVLGGDHSITYPVLCAVASVHTELTILHIDAHADLYDEFEGDRFSHACPFARIMEERLAARLVQVGIRTLSGHQRAQADRFGVTVIDMRAWEQGVRPQLDGPLYVSLDIDALDPAYAPGVSHWEPGGLRTRDVITMLQQLRGPIVGADLVELNPQRDVSGRTAMVAAKLLKELLAAMMRGAPSAG